MVRFIALLIACEFLTVGLHIPVRAGETNSAGSREVVRGRSYPEGMSRDEVRRELAGSWRLVSAARPASGWSKEFAAPAGSRAGSFERVHPGVTVEVCDVYRVGHTNAPWTYHGVWLTYFYYDRSKKLIGTDRWVIE